MVRRLLLITALAAALMACTPSSGTSSSPGLESLAPIESLDTSSMAPSTSPAP
jgi:hypothetical protein